MPSDRLFTIINPCEHAKQQHRRALHQCLYFHMETRPWFAIWMEYVVVIKAQVRHDIQQHSVIGGK